jgi:hypothetical protein
MESLLFIQTDCVKNIDPHLHQVERRINSNFYYQRQLLSITYMLNPAASRKNNFSGPLAEPKAQAANPGSMKYRAVSLEEIIKNS